MLVQTTSIPTWFFVLSKDEMGIDENAITEEMIEEWIKTKVSSMMATAWWNENGEEFEEMFNEIKELDLENQRALYWKVCV